MATTAVKTDTITFNDLNLAPEIHKALEICGYTTPTPIQAKAIPNILEGKDVVASAQTGTGKTAAFVLPALHQLSQTEHTKKPRVLILTPTRELANQITKAGTQYGKFLKFNLVNLVGGMPYHQQIRELQRGADIIVATPGRLLDLFDGKHVNLSNIKMLILDEADRMVDMGFIDDVEYIAKLIPEERQTLLFSATINKELSNIVRHLLKHPVRIDLSNEKLTVPTIEQQFYKTNSPQHKTRLLTHFIDQGIYKAIIFTATKVYADKIADFLADQGYKAGALHGDLRQNVRNRTIDQLRSGKIQFLVATDVAARGIDISDITHVFNYDMPRFSEDYVHRIGRTGRAGKSGIAISFVSPTDSKHIKSIERYIGEHIKLISNFDTAEIKRPKTAAHQIDNQDDDDSGDSDSGSSFKKESNPKISYRKRDESSSPRRSSGEKRSFGGDKPFRSKAAAAPGRRSIERGGDRFERSDRDDRKPSRFGKPERSERSGGRFERSERPERAGRSFDRAPRFERSERSERPARGTDRAERSSRSSERPARFDRSDRPERSGRSSERPARFERSDRAERPSKSSDRAPRFERSDRSERPARGGERRERSFSSDKPRASFKDRSDSPRAAKKPFDSDRPRAAKRVSEGRADKPFKKKTTDSKSRWAR